MSSFSFEEQYTWRNQIIEAVKWNYDSKTKNPIFFNPVNYYSLQNQLHNNHREAMEFNLNALRNSNLVIVNFNEPNSLGTCAELAIAYEMRIPIIGINKDNKELHPWLTCFTNKMCKNLKEAVSYVVEFYLN